MGKSLGIIRSLGGCSYFASIIRSLGGCSYFAGIIRSLGGCSYFASIIRSLGGCSYDRRPLRILADRARASGWKRIEHGNVCRSSTRQLALFGY